MADAKMFLLQKIIKSDKTYLKSLKELHAKHIDDISEVMNEFALLTLIESSKKKKIK